MRILINLGTEILEGRAGRYISDKVHTEECEPNSGEFCFVWGDPEEYAKFYVEQTKDAGLVEFTGSVKDVK